MAAIIPTLNAASRLPELLAALRRQTHPVTEIIVIDSGSADETVELVRRDTSVRLLEIPSEDFDHGRTRDTALHASNAEFIWFLTQDAVPRDDCLAHLLEAFRDSHTAAAYARQIASDRASRIEQLTRGWNYPDEGHTRSPEDFDRLGVRAIRLSNTCAVYRREAYERCGGFRYPLPTNEDMLMAYRFLHAGCTVVYCAEACVNHWHKIAIRAAYRRYFDIGAFFTLTKDEMHVPSIQGEGLSYVTAIAGRLLKEARFISLLRFGCLCAARWLGNHDGARCETLSAKRLMRSTQNPAFWRGFITRKPENASQDKTLHSSTR